MPFSLAKPSNRCNVCGMSANIQADAIGVTHINCARCGDFDIPRLVVDDMSMLLKDDKSRALASHAIRKMQGKGPRPHLARDFFEALKFQTLPMPAEASDNLIIWLTEQADGRPGKLIEIGYASPDLLGFVGVIDPSDIGWIVTTLREGGFLYCEGLDRKGPLERNSGMLTVKGWSRFEEIKRAKVSSSFAFFARKFANTDLDIVFVNCLQPAVKATGYELRTVPQRAGLVDAIIEDDIRRCRFLIADLTDDNSGAYWEAGFAEGLGKPVIYVCRDGVKTHFDADHRQTVRWDLADLDDTAIRLKAVIRNTLLGDAVQSD